MAKMEKASMEMPDETREFPNGHLDLVNIGGFTFGLATFDPGWRWSESLKEASGTDSCQQSHTNYHISGKLHVKMGDGEEEEFGPGDIGIIPPGHDAWVVGDEPVVVLDITGMGEYAKSS